MTIEWAGVFAMLLLILISAISIGVVILLYQLLLQKYYWGPKGAPKKSNQKEDSD
jgi:hypothetical protein